MPTALWNDRVVAESEQFEEVEGNIYFPPEALNRGLVRPSERTTVCGWKGTARYFDLIDGDQVATNAVWTYPDPEAGSREHQGPRRLLLPACAGRDLVAPAGAAQRTNPIACHRSPVHNFAGSRARLRISAIGEVS